MPHGEAPSTTAPQDPDVPGAGVTVWLTGLPSSGKSTIARSLAGRLSADGRRVQVLDGDELRARLSPDLGFSRADRDANVRRIGLVAELLATHGVTVLVPVIAPYAALREEVARRHAEQGLRYVEVHVEAPLTVCRSRDVKGLYGLHDRGAISGLTGVDDPYEEPEAPDLVIRTAGEPVSSSVDRLYALLGAGSR